MHKKPELFPGKIAIKVFFVNDEKVKESIISMVKKYFPIEEHHVKHSHSTQKNYMGLTFDVYAETEEPVHQLYQELSQHPDIKLVL
jgi:putative lipoic acid-binding regulatory protein